jgi:hypothetical protein
MGTREAVDTPLHPKYAALFNYKPSTAFGYISALDDVIQILMEQGFEGMHRRLRSC